jgi:hypothetical protein
MLDKPSRVHSHLDYVFLVSLIYDTLGRKPGHIVNTCHFYSRLGIIFDIFVKTYVTDNISCQPQGNIANY